MIIRKGVSPVIATVILSGVVLMIGGGLWSYSLEAPSSVATDTRMLDLIQRFKKLSLYHRDIK